MTAVLAGVDAHLRDQVASYCASTGVPGVLAGVYHDGNEVLVAHGQANIVTGAAMVTDTGFILGSITKVMTTTLILQQVEQGVLDLDERVVSYLPDFNLASSPDLVAEIRVRNLLTHTSGIDADLFLPDFKGRDALKLYLERLGRQCGMLFAPEEYVSYSNGGHLVAGRLLEAVTGDYFHDILEREIFAATGMSDSCTSADKAILRSTAVGHFRDHASGQERRTDMFMLPESWSAVGSTPVVTIHDLLAFGRTYMSDGVSPAGKRILSSESVDLMSTPTGVRDLPYSAPLGLGWSLVPCGDITVLWHGGSSPGGTAMLVVVPQHDLAFATFANDARSRTLHDELTLWLLGEYLNLEVPEIEVRVDKVSDLARYEGTYRSNQLRIDVKVKDGQLEEEMVFEPLDDEQARIWNSFFGSLAFPTRPLVPIQKDLCAPVGAPLKAFMSFGGGQPLVAFLGDSGGRPTHRSDGRVSRRQ